MVRSHRSLGSVIPSTSSPKTTATPPVGKVNFEVSELSDEQIHGLLHSLRVELHERALESDDPEVLGLEFLSSLNGKDVERPEILSGRFIALGGIIKYNPAGTKHHCVLYSITMPGADPFWAWEDHGTLAYSHSTRVGDMRQSVALHVAVDGMQLIRHTMKHDGERHHRLSEDVWDCVWAENGEGSLQVVKSKTNPRNLPVPNH